MSEIWIVIIAGDDPEFFEVEVFSSKEKAKARSIVLNNAIKELCKIECYDERYNKAQCFIDDIGIDLLSLYLVSIEKGKLR